MCVLPPVMVRLATEASSSCWFVGGKYRQTSQDVTVGAEVVIHSVADDSSLDEDRVSRLRREKAPL